MIDERVNTFFVRSLQLDADTLRLEYERMAASTEFRQF
jgi:hypothetical protein